MSALTQQTTAKLQQLPPLSLYIHIPWCIRKCPYCDFNSHQQAVEDIPQQEYIKQLLRDLEQDLLFVQERTLSSIFIGGGTPSLFQARYIEQLLKEIEHRIRFSADIEITMEVNPGSLENKRLIDFYHAGINRVSLGVQSFSDDHLRRLGRVHDSTLAKQALEQAHQAGFQQINIDLMHGLPQQSRQTALQDLETAFSFSPSHISWYQLTIEANTQFYSQPPQLPHENILDDIFVHGHTLLTQHQFNQYEVSAFSKPQCQSQHNINYWTFGDYLGIGAGAHGKITQQNNNILRTKKTRTPKDYLSKQASNLCISQAVANCDIALEFFMNALRLNQGFSIALFEERTKLKFDPWQTKFAELINAGLLHQQDQHYATTALGQRYLNNVLAAL